MKKLMIGAVMMTLSMAVSAQGDAISKFFAKYQDDETFTNVKVSQKMFSLFTNMSVEKQEDKDILDAISKIQGLRVLAKHETRDSRALYKEAMAAIPAKDYEELLSVRDKDKDMKFYIKELSSGKIGELVMVSGGNSEFMVLSLFGEIDLKKIGSIGKKMSIDGLDKLEKINDKKN
ncbi:MAG: hypothetical protein OJF59_001601 [Cytophagales bacterium]|jgi:hypothetical protein|nr:DUF4252 domain-containing protein [Bacteroidota bacterium]MBS1980530.1 DUF4252 domain-containing protein [Bacteroidota bacterium]WHZ07848.1 MAG: hypothetical protein OJF59_001601 [Cytophagales bacterium]